MKYTQEHAGHLVKEWTQTRERLRKRLRGLDSAIDLDGGVKSLDERLRKRIARLVREGFEPEKVNDKYPEPAALLVIVDQLKGEGKMREAAYVSRTIRDIRLLRVLAFRMSGRRTRKEILVKASPRLTGVCWACHKWVIKEEEIWWDRDRGVMWHKNCDLDKEKTGVFQ